LLVVVVGAIYAATLPTKWIGSYSYQYVMGHSSGAPAPAWIFNLTVRPDGSCELTWQGYQKDDDIICKASGKSEDLEIYYVSFADGGATNPSGYEAYKQGEKLLELKATKSGGKIWTRWGALNKGDVLKDGFRFERD
jgi:hypothetical protein